MIGISIIFDEFAKWKKIDTKFFNFVQFVGRVKNSSYPSWRSKAIGRNRIFALFILNSIYVLTSFDYFMDVRHWRDREYSEMLSGQSSPIYSDIRVICEDKRVRYRLEVMKMYAGVHSTHTYYRSIIKLYGYSRYISSKFQHVSSA